MRGALAGLRLHFAARLRAAATEPSSIVFLVGGALATLLLWPGLTGPGGEGWRLAPATDTPLAFEMSTVLLWLVLWPVLPASAAAGRVAAPSQGEAFAQRACPALPARPRARMLAEALLVLLPVALAHAAALLVPGTTSPGARLAAFAEGALVALPIVLAWTAPAPSVPLLWVRPALVVALLAAAVPTGLLGSLPGLASASAGLSAVVLASAGLDLRPVLAGIGWRALPPTPARPALPPARQLRRDFVLEPARRLGPVVATLVLLQAAVLVAESVRPLPPYVFFVVSVVVLGQVLALALRPAGSAIVPWSFRGRADSKNGDLLRVFAVLPVRPESVRRAAWVHGLVVSLAVWAGGVAVAAIRALQTTGRLALVDSDGDSLAPFALLGLAVVPVVAGLVVSATAGDGRKTAFSGGALLALFNVPGMSFVVARAAFGATPRTAAAVAIGIIALLVVVGSLPPLTLLRRTPRPA